MRRIKMSAKVTFVATCLLAGIQGCVVADAVGSADPYDDEDASVPLEDKANSGLSTDQLVQRVSQLPDKSVVVFDFDDTLYDHLGNGTSRWASFAQEAISVLKKHSVNIAIASRNKNEDGALNSRLKKLNPQVFTNAFFASPAFQDNTGVEKWDDIQQIMAYYRVKREDHVIFYDDTMSNINSVAAKSDVVTVPVGPNGLDQSEFRDGMIELLDKAGGGGSSGGGSSGGASSGGGNSGGGGAASCKGKCSKSCPCQLGEGDCDSNVDCAAGLICPPDGPGMERCEKASSGSGSGGSTGGGSTKSCKGKCSPSCPCQLGEGDCDTNADCAGSLICPPDGPGAEQCKKP